MTSLINNLIVNNGINQTQSESVKRDNASYLLNESIKKDTVVINKNNDSQNKKKLTKGQKVLFGITGAALALIGARCLIRGQIGALNRLYFEKIKLSNLPEHIDFNPAKTVEEGINFTKNVLGIKHVDDSFTLEAINFVNEGLVNVSNANKGKFFLPPSMFFEEMANNTIASVNYNVHNKNFASLSINSLFFDEKYLDKKIASLNKEFIDYFKNNPSDDSVSFEKHFLLNDKTIELLKKFANNELNDINDKRKLLSDTYLRIDMFSNDIPIVDGGKVIDSIPAFSSPYGIIMSLKDELKKIGVNIDENNLKKLDWTGLNATLYGYICKLNKYLVIPASDSLRTMYHELGHLQDFALNLKNIHLSVFNDSPSFVFDPINNRWGGKTYEGFSELLESNPNKFKAMYPDLYEHLNNPEYQRIAGRVSGYAGTSIGEFVAEVYASLIEKRNVADEIMDLYKKYGGPIPGELN